jgi:hypothetical protein
VRGAGGERGAVGRLRALHALLGACVALGVSVVSAQLEDEEARGGQRQQLLQRWGLGTADKPAVRGDGRRAQLTPPPLPTDTSPRSDRAGQGLWSC